MASVSYEFPVNDFRGKVCKHAKVQFKKYGPSGKAYTSQVCNPYTGNPSADQLTQRAIFKAASDYAKNTMLDSTKRKAAELRFKNRTGGYLKYISLRNFLMAESFNGDEV